MFLTSSVPICTISVSVLIREIFDDHAAERYEDRLLQRRICIHLIRIDISLFTYILYGKMCCYQAAECQTYLILIKCRVPKRRVIMFRQKPEVMFQPYSNCPYPIKSIFLNIFLKVFMFFLYLCPPPPQTLTHISAPSQVAAHQRK